MICNAIVAIAKRLLLCGLVIGLASRDVFAQEILNKVTGEMAFSSENEMSQLHFKLGDMYLDLYRVAGQHKAENFRAAIDHYERGLRFDPDNVHYHNRLGYAYHLERRLKEASREYAKALELDSPQDVTPEEFDLILKLAPRIYVHADEFFNLDDVVVILHPKKPIIEFSFFWDDDVNFPADNDPTDHEKVWIEYDPASGDIVKVYTYFHRAILSTKEALADARNHNNRARINVQWGGHGSLPVGWETIPPEEITIKYASIPTPDRIKDMQGRYQEHRKSIRMPNHPLAKEWPKKFAGSWEDYIQFTKYVDLPKMIAKKKMVMKSRWSNAVIDQYFIDYQFFPKIAWPDAIP